jgi:uncharacterized protein (DUF4415 family)
LTEFSDVDTIPYIRKVGLRWIWDPDKAKKNLEKHKVSFELAERALGDPLCVSVPDPCPNEERWRTLGSPSIDGIVVLYVVHTCPRMNPVRVESSAQDERKPMRGATMKRGNPEPLTPELKAELDALAAMPESEIDTTDMPPIADWSYAVRGPFYRPIKRPLSLRVDADIIDWFQRQGQGYQTRMNLALREYVDRHREHA